MTKTKELINAVKTSLRNLITKDTPQEDIDKITEIDKQIDKVSESHNHMAEEYGSLKDKYIDVIKMSGTTEVPAGEKKARSFEEVCGDIIKNRR